MIWHSAIIEPQKAATEIVYINMRSLGILGQLCFVLYYTFRAHVGLIIAFFFWSQGDWQYVHNKKTSESTCQFSYNVNAQRTGSFYTNWKRFDLVLFNWTLNWQQIVGKTLLGLETKGIACKFAVFLHPCWTWKLLFQWDFMSFHSFGFAILTVVLGWMYIISSFFQSNVGLLKMFFKNCPNTVCPSSTRGNPVCYYIGICDGECGSCTFSSGVC